MKRKEIGTYTMVILISIAFILFVIVFPDTDKIFVSGVLVGLFILLILVNVIEEIKEFKNERKR